jgi:hypothetical protein
MFTNPSALFLPCEERKELLKKAASALREHEELKHKADVVIGTDKYQELNKTAIEAMHKAETALASYLHHVREHGC